MRGGMLAYMYPRFLLFETDRGCNTYMYPRFLLFETDRGCNSRFLNLVCYKASSSSSSK